jgi:hypothetical protein
MNKKCLVFYLLSLLTNYIETKDSDNLVEIKEILTSGHDNDVDSIINYVKIISFKIVRKIC